MADKLVERRVGSIRPSQMMYTYGVGSTVDLTSFTVIVAGLDDWDPLHQPIIREPRLLAAVRLDDHVGMQVEQLRGAPWEPETSKKPFDPANRVGVPVIPFPRWLRCSRCNLLSDVDSGLFPADNPLGRPNDASYRHKGCPKGGNPAALPVRFVIACPAGHLDEFPWVEFCHGGGVCPGKPLLELKDVGEGTRSTSQRIECKTCGANNVVSKAFGPGSEAVLPMCRGRMPHLRSISGKCKNQASALFLGASNAWFAVTRAALSIPAAHDPLGQLVADHFEKLAKIPSREVLPLMLSMADELKPLEAYDLDAVWAAIEHRKVNATSGPADADLLGPEWEMLKHPETAPAGPDFRIVGARVPEGFEGLLSPTVLAERLREVVVLTGFTRMDAPEWGDAGGSTVRAVPLSRERPKWLPASETRGEGIFLRLPEDAVHAWEVRVADTDRPTALREGLRRWRTRRGLDASEGWPGVRYLLLHSLSHALINELALECGYSAASIRERIYAREPGGKGDPMAGILLYTAAPDSEGTLGGLVSLGRPDVLGRMLRQALQHASLCSTDPICAGHLPDEQNLSLHAASCHACLFLPETSCESGNRFLDRAVLAEVLGKPGISYFPASTRSIDS